jgi:osmotically-inducible protein OsmY
MKCGTAELGVAESVILSLTHTFSGGVDMGWLDRLFGHHDQQTQAPAPQAQQPQATAQATIPPERVGLNGEYDQSGLAKRVAKAFDAAGLDDHQSVWIAQTSGTVVLKGSCHDQELLNKMVEIARGISGATAVETNQVKIGK